MAAEAAEEEEAMNLTNDEINMLEMLSGGPRKITEKYDTALADRLCQVGFADFAPESTLARPMYELTPAGYGFREWLRSGQTVTVDWRARQTVARTLRRCAIALEDAANHAHEEVWNRLVRDMGKILPEGKA
jgi:hypothetical protein